MTDTSPANGSIAADYATDGFDINNLPYASFTPPSESEARLGVRIGDHVLDVRAAVERSNASDDLETAVSGVNLDDLLAAGRPVWDKLRTILTHELSDGDRANGLQSHLYPINDVMLHLPFSIADYIDFYASEHHATNVGKIFRPNQAALTPNWKHLPIGYHGRAGTIFPSETSFARPKGLRPEPEGGPTFGPSRRLDIEAEVGFIMGGDVPEGEVKQTNADEHIFGVTLVNDWSARDIQAFEYVPLGPFLGKSFATSISVWVTPMAALATARIDPPDREHQLASYLDDSETRPWGLDLMLEIEIDGQVVSRPPFSTMYWTAAQMLAHMTVNGAGLRSGDFFASGTVSGVGQDQRGSFLELSWGGNEPLQLKSGQEMTFLQDGQTVTIRATAPGPNDSTIALGTVTGTVNPAR